MDDRPWLAEWRAAAIPAVALVVAVQLVIGIWAVTARDARPTVAVATEAPVVGLRTGEPASAEARLPSGSLAGLSAPEAAQVTGVVFDGQSLVNYPYEGGSTAQQTAALLAPMASAAVALDGTSYAERWVSFESRLAPVLRPGGWVLVDVSGQSDLLDGLTARALYDEMLAYHRRALEAGAVATVVSTVPAVGPDWPGWTPAVEAERLALNEMLRGSTDFAAVADLAALPEASDGRDPRYYTHQIHPTVELAQHFARVLAAAVRAATA